MMLNVIAKFTRSSRHSQASFRAGGIASSVFTLITAILDSGVITLPFIAAKNGIVLAAILIVFGAAISYF